MSADPHRSPAFQRTDLACSLPTEAASLVAAAHLEAGALVARSPPLSQGIQADQAAGRLVITLDRGVADSRRYPPGSHAGIDLLRLPDHSVGTVGFAVRRLVLGPTSRTSEG
ncbi:MAG TPA: hypothetical protein VHM94_00055 [Acidimicrobiia bacterium]|jgi:hypothetical protein|nr:hypothetical protein [Acidimicrobiia bacterium]